MGSLPEILGAKAQQSLPVDILVYRADRVVFFFSIFTGEYLNDYVKLCHQQGSTLQILQRKTLEDEGMLPTSSRRDPDNVGQRTWRQAMKTGLSSFCAVTADS